MAKSKPYKKDFMKNTRPFFTFVNRFSAEPRYLSECIEMQNLARIIIGNNGVVTMNHRDKGCLFMIRCTPKAYDDIRIAFEGINPGVCDYDIKLSKYEF